MKKCAEMIDLVRVQLTELELMTVNIEVSSDFNKLAERSVFEQALTNSHHVQKIHKSMAIWEQGIDDLMTSFDTLSIMPAVNKAGNNRLDSRKYVISGSFTSSSSVESVEYELF